MERQSQTPLSESFSAMTKGIRRLGELYISKARLKTTEKLTILLSTIAFSAVVAAIALVFILFVTIGVGHLLATSIAPHLAYLLVAGFYLLVLLVILFMRRTLFIDPISRFLSRLLVEAPESSGESEESPSKTDKASDLRELTAETPEIDYDRLAQHIIAELDRNKKSAANNYSVDDIDLTDKPEGGES